jgi:hypothetical protein
LSASADQERYAAMVGASKQVSNIKVNIMLAI